MYKLLYNLMYYYIEHYVYGEKCFFVVTNCPIMSQPSTTPAERNKEEMKICKKLLEALISRISYKPRHTLDNVKRLIQGLLVSYL